MYNHFEQYRCTIIRGKSQKDMDELLPAYAKVLMDICPCSTSVFQKLFDTAFAKHLPLGTTRKTLDNHRTEICGKLFGMYYQSPDGNVYISERALKFVEDEDTPAFFKDLCYKMQFPNGSQKIQTVIERVNSKIKLRSNSYILKFLLEANAKNLIITKKDIGYYVLNSLHVLQGKAEIDEVLRAIQEDRRAGITREVVWPGKASSYNVQHINEQLKLLTLANLITIDESDYVFLNKKEISTINIFANDYKKPLMFDTYAFNLLNDNSKKDFYFKWDEYFAKLSDHSAEFKTNIEFLIDIPAPSTETKKPTFNLTEFGDEGEGFVLDYEKKRVFNFNPRLVNKVVHLGKTKGLGYDIQSVVALPGEFAEFVKYIEVKSTKRVTAPSLDDSMWLDTLNLTRNEWIAAKQHRDMYSIYRLYFTKSGVVMFVITDVAQKEKEGKLQVTPMTYRVDFGMDAVSNVIQNGATI